MSWHYSRALVEEYLVGNCSDGARSVQSSSTRMPEAFYWPDKTTEHSRPSRFGMTSEPLTEYLGEALLMLFLAAFRAKTSAAPEKEPASTGTEADSGAIWQGSFAKYDRATSSWKTRQCSLLGGSTEISGTRPKWGSMRDGELLAPTTLEPPTNGKGCGLWPTPTCGGGGQTLPEGTTPTGKTPEGRKQTVCLERYVQMVEKKIWPTPTVCGNYNRKGSSATSGDGLETAVKRHLSDARSHGRQTQQMRLNPEWVEWLMGWPIGWTELRPLGTDRFREWLQQHGGF